MGTKVQYAFLMIMIFTLSLFSCKKNNMDEPDPIVDTLKIGIDSIIATKTNLIVWEEIFITVYAQGENLTYSWSTNHGSMTGKDSVTVKYWACHSCIGINTVKCEVENEHGIVSDTIVINVTESK